MRTRAAAALAALVVVVPVSARGEAGGTSTSPSEPATSVPAATTASTPSTEAAASSAPSSDAPDTSSPPADRADGVLTIGTLLPVTGPGNQIGIAAINAVNVGVRTINEGSGVLDQPVRWVNASEGESPDEAQAGVDQLLAANVDAVIGPASSLIALEVLDELMAAGVLVCSPAATALSLNDYPDRELFFRTVPSDSLMAQAMAVVASNTGVDTYAVVYLDDQFGRPFAQEAIRRLEGPEIEAPYEVPFPTDATPEELADLASQLGRARPANRPRHRRLGTGMADARGDVRRVRHRSAVRRRQRRHAHPAEQRLRHQLACRVPRTDPGPFAGRHAHVSRAGRGLRDERPRLSQPDRPGHRRCRDRRPCGDRRRDDERVRGGDSVQQLRPVPGDRRAGPQRTTTRAPMASTSPLGATLRRDASASSASTPTGSTCPWRR